MKISNILKSITTFLAGSLLCYIALQIKFFKVEFSVNVLELFLTIAGILVAIYIANDIQKSINSNQNRNSFITGRIGVLWDDFNNHTENILGDRTIEVSEIHQFQKDCIYSAVYLKNIFEAFNYDTASFEKILVKMEELEIFISDLPADKNRVTLTGKETELKSKINEIHKLLADSIASFQ